MKGALARRKRRIGTRRRKKHVSAMSEREMDDLFYMYSNEDLPEIESDLYDREVRPQISRDYYL